MRTCRLKAPLALTDHEGVYNRGRFDAGTTIEIYGPQPNRSGIPVVNIGQPGIAYVMAVFARANDVTAACAYPSPRPARQMSLVGQVARPRFHSRPGGDNELFLLVRDRTADYLAEKGITSYCRVEGNLIYRTPECTDQYEGDLFPGQTDARDALEDRFNSGYLDGYSNTRRDWRNNLASLQQEVDAGRITVAELIAYDAGWNRGRRDSAADFAVSRERLRQRAIELGLDPDLINPDSGVDVVRPPTLPRRAPAPIRAPDLPIGSASQEPARWGVFGQAVAAAVLTAPAWVPIFFLPWLRKRG